MKNLIEKLEKLEMDNRIPSGFLEKYNKINKAELLTYLAEQMKTLPSEIFRTEYKYTDLINNLKIKIVAVKFFDESIKDSKTDYKKAITIYDNFVNVINNINN